MFANMFVGAHAGARKQRRVFIGHDRDDVEIGARHRNLIEIGKTHDALRNVDAVAEDIGLAVDIARQFDRAEIDALAQLQFALTGFEAGRFLPDQIAHFHADKQRVFRVAQKTQRRAITGIEDEALIGGNIPGRFAQKRVKTVFEFGLLGNRNLGKADDVDKGNTANKSAFALIKRRFGYRFLSRCARCSVGTKISGELCMQFGESGIDRSCRRG